jgi:hypothetical protein
MSEVVTRKIQRGLGLGGLVWAISLLPRTSVTWWIGANVLYGVLAFISAGLLVRGHRRTGMAAATAGVIIFSGVNGYFASTACGMGGACMEVVTVMAAIVPLQVAIVIVNGRFDARQPN